MGKKQNQIVWIDEIEKELKKKLRRRKKVPFDGFVVEFWQKYADRGARIPTIVRQIRELRNRSMLETDGRYIWKVKLSF